MNVSILGAGPAGLSAAINLAKEGYEVDVFEKKSSVGSRFIGDFQGLENWTKKEDILKSLKKMNIESKFDYTPFKKLTLRNREKFWDFYLDRPAFYLVRRGTMSGSLDHGIKEQALDLGVNIEFGVNIPEEEADIVATGPITGEKFAAASAIVFETNMDNVALALVDNATAIKGYSYLLVADGHGTLSTVLFDDFQHLNDCFKKTQKVFNEITDLDVQNPCKSGGIGSFSNQNVYQRDKTLYVGESAGLQDLLWGFGIRSAIKSGYLAAKSIINKENYDQTANEQFRSRLKSSMVNRFFWEVTEDQSWIVNRIHHANDPLKYLRSFHNFNLLQRLFYPFARYYLKKRYVNLRL